jgi:hypothetical protein
MIGGVTRRAAWLLAFLLAGCGTTISTPSPSAISTPSVNPDGAALLAARGDLDHLLASIEQIHPDPWHGIERTAWVASLDALKAELGTLTPDQSVVALMRLVALLSRQGRDGHQFALPEAGSEASVLPIRVYEFAEGLYLTAALPPYQDLAGARIVALGGHPIAAVLAALEPLVPRDGPATVAGFRPVFLLRTEVLRGLGLIGDGAVSLTVDVNGTERSVDLSPVSFDDYVSAFGMGGMTHLPSRADTLYLSNDAVIWTDFLADSGTLYVRYTQVQDLSSAVGAIGDRASQPDVERIVLDLRQNPGGDNHSYPPLLAILRDFADAHPGRLVVLTDRLTFSAAANFATEIEQATDATFVGEPMGGGLNFWDDVTWVALPHLPVPMRVGVSTRYWQKAAADDPRLTIEPQIALPVRAADYFAGVDPALEAAVAVR